MRSLVRVGSTSAAAVLALAAFLLAGCTDEKIVFREPFNPPPDEAAGLIGYFTSSDKSTTCGNCHVDHQNKWENTAHADAYETLVNSGSAQPFCYSCHTVSENGNQLTGAAGWNVVQDTAYHDVQCESCHGPGADHVETPDASDHPLARIRVLANDVASGNIDADTATVAGSCAECHSGAHHPFVDEWAASGHARALREGDIFIADENPASCAPCHEGRAALKAWGVTANYFERDTATADAHFGTTCAVCHDPHNSQFEGQLRYSITDGSFEGNLCMKCHVRRYEPAGTSPRGPHAPQGAVLTGTAGYWPPGFDTTASFSTHGNPTANPRLCAGCHVNSFEVEDRLQPGNTILSTGHSFLPVPCLDPTSGEPTEARDCAFDATSRYWGSCTKSGCHADASAASLALNSQRADIETLANILWRDADGDMVLYDTLATGDFGAFDAGDTGLLTEIADPTTAINHKDRVVSIAEGALFNIRLVGEDRYENGDKSLGVHNPFLATALLAASIEAVDSAYGLGALRLSPSDKALLDRVNAKMQQSRRQMSSR